MKKDKPVAHYPTALNSGSHPRLNFKGLDIKQNGDDFIIEKSDDPNAMPKLAKEIVERIDAGAFASLGEMINPFESTAKVDHPTDKRNKVPGLTMPSGMTPPKPHRFGPGYDNSTPVQTMRATRNDTDLKRTLLNIVNKKAGSPPPQYDDDRPLIDLLHEATFTEPDGLQWIEKKYDLRMLLRKAHCFTLDKETSAMVGDFSLAIASDLESARRMAIPPFPVTWIEINNIARLDRLKERGVKLTAQAAGETEAGPPVERVGWLIHPEAEGGHYATYVALVGAGVMVAPLSYFWCTGPTNGEELQTMLLRESDIDVAFVERLTFGVNNSGVYASDARPSPTPLHTERMQNMDEASYSANVRELMTEIGGELRHVWGFLIALGAGQLGIEAKYSDQPKPQSTPPTMKNGKPLLPLEHKVLHLHLARKMTPDKVVARMTTHHKHRWHEVRGHFRLLKSGRRVPIKPHARGDKRLGVIEKTYRVER